MPSYLSSFNKKNSVAGFLTIAYRKLFPANLQFSLDSTIFKRVIFNEPGTLNNQEKREAVVREILGWFKPDAVIETGTFKGAGTKFFLSNTQGCEVLTCELNENFYRLSSLRFKNDHRAKVINKNSIDFLSKNLDHLAGDRKYFFYLDAHWNDYLPLKDEVKLIFDKFPNSIILIDDFAVPHDKGYGYDNWGDGKVLNIEYLNGINTRDFEIFFPNIPSNIETGAKRGCCFLVAETSAIELLKSNGSLTHFIKGKMFSGEGGGNDGKSIITMTTEPLATVRLNLGRES